MAADRHIRETLIVWTLIAAICSLAQAQYGGGSGTADDPYLIYTPEQMNAIGADPNDWDKHFKLMADIDLAQYTGTEFNLIGSSSLSFRGTFDGDDHTISNLTYVGQGEGCAGLFTHIADPNAEIWDLGLVAPKVHVANGESVGSLVGVLGLGAVTNCYARGGSVVGNTRVGGLIGQCLSGRGLGPSFILGCYTDVAVIGDYYVGGLVGSGRAVIVDCYATGAVIGWDVVGGLAGANEATITNCYAAGTVVGDRQVGGLVGAGDARDVVGSFWDVQGSRQQASVGGEGKTTAQLQTVLTFRAWSEGASAGFWTIDDGNDYPRLAWEHRSGIVIEALDIPNLLRGGGTAGDPYLIYTADELELIASEPNEWDKHFRLMADVDLSVYPGVGFNAGSGDTNFPFAGVFDGNGHTISNSTHICPEGRAFAGFFGYLKRTPCGGRTRVDCDSITPPLIDNFGLLHPMVDGRLADYSGALIGFLGDGTVSGCYVEGGLVLGGSRDTGGLVGLNQGTVTQCYAIDGTVVGGRYTHGLVGSNDGLVEDCYSENTVIEDQAEEF